MTDFYTELATVAHELIAEYGAVCKLGVPSNGAYDPATGKATVSYADQNMTAAVFDFPQKYIDGTLIKVGDKCVLASTRGLTSEPAPGFRFTDANGIQQQVINVKKIAPAGANVLWVLQVRK